MGISARKSLNEDVTKWRQEEFNVFKKILYKFIPLIRFCDIPSEDYFDKVRPYEEILSKELKEQILKFHMVPGYKPTLNTYTERWGRYEEIEKCNRPGKKKFLDSHDPAVSVCWKNGKKNFIVKKFLSRVLIIK